MYIELTSMKETIFSTNHGIPIIDGTFVDTLFPLWYIEPLLTLIIYKIVEINWNKMIYIILNIYYSIDFIL